MAGAECKEKRSLDANTPVPMHGRFRQTVGEWNTNATVCAGNNVKTISITGQFMNEITECTISFGLHLAFKA